jgi:hypothetical protein
MLDLTTVRISPPDLELGRPSPKEHRVRAVAVSAVAYLVASIVVWWNVWSASPSSTTTCGCGDSSLFTWFLDWPAYAMSHGLNPLYSTAMFHPGGVNLLANTAEVGLGVVLSPVTWLFGPVATLNVALTLSPFLSAMAMFVLLRRWTSWAPAAFIGGLLYGFSPFVLVSLTDAHLMLGMTFVPPLLVICLDELLARQRGRPIPAGLLLGLLLAVQFFIGTEMLTIIGVGILVGVVLVVLWGSIHLEVFRRRVRFAAVGLSTAVVTAAALLAYPVWFALAGPAHFSGPVWSDSLMGWSGTSLRNYVLPAPPSVTFSNLEHQVGGYQGLNLSGQYFGLGLLVVLLVGLVIYRRDLRLWLFSGVGLASWWLSEGLQNHYWVPWRILAKLPLIQNVIPGRFVALTYLAAAVMLGIVVDHTYASVNRQVRLTRSGDRGQVGLRRLVPGAVGCAVAALAIGPVAGYLSTDIPMTTQTVRLPAWFRQTAPHLAGHQVILVLPVPFTLLQSSMTWQAVDEMHYSMVGGGGPGGQLSRSGVERPGQVVLARTWLGLKPMVVTSDNIRAVRNALNGWRVTMAVVPDTSTLPPYEQVALVRTSVALITAATGQAPIRQSHAWVWSNLEHAGPPVVPTSVEFGRCVSGPPDGTVQSIDQSVSCVLRPVGLRLVQHRAG